MTFSEIGDYVASGVLLVTVGVEGAIWIGAFYFYKRNPYAIHLRAEARRPGARQATEGRPIPTSPERTMMIEVANTQDEPRASRSIGLIGAAYGLDRQIDPAGGGPIRCARDTDSTRRDPFSWWEPNIPKDKPRPFSWGPPMLGAPSGPMLWLQRAFVAQLEPAWLTTARAIWRLVRVMTRRRVRQAVTVDRACWVGACIGLAWLCLAVLSVPAP